MLVSSRDVFDHTRGLVDRVALPKLSVPIPVRRSRSRILRCRPPPGTTARSLTAARNPDHEMPSLRRQHQRGSLENPPTRRILGTVTGRGRAGFPVATTRALAVENERRIGRVARRMTRWRDVLARAGRESSRLSEGRSKTRHRARGTTVPSQSAAYRREPVRSHSLIP